MRRAKRHLQRVPTIVTQVLCGACASKGWLIISVTAVRVLLALRRAMRMNVVRGADYDRTADGAGAAQKAMPDGHRDVCVPAYP